MATYFPEKECQDLDPHWKQCRSILITKIDSGALFFFTQEGSDEKILIQTNIEYRIEGLKQICYHWETPTQGIPTLQYRLGI